MICVFDPFLVPKDMPQSNKLDIQFNVSARAIKQSVIMNMGLP